MCINNEDEIKFDKVKFLKKLLNGLPPAYNEPYWEMADLSYSEELLYCAFIEKLLTADQVSKICKGAKLCRKSILNKLTSGRLEERMGVLI